MQRTEALALLQAFFQKLGIDSPGLNSANLGGAMVGEAQLYFDFQPKTGTLRCSALLHSFAKPPKPEVLRAFEQSAASPELNPQRAKVEYEPENRGLYLSLVHERPIAPARFAEQMADLMESSLRLAYQVPLELASKRKR